MGTGENSGTWGTVTNTNLGTALEEAIVGSTDVTFASADFELTLTDTNAAQPARNLRLNLGGTTGGARNLYLVGTTAAPGANIEKVYIINNGTADTITVRNKKDGSPTGTSIAIPTGKTMYVYNTGANIVDAVTHLTSLTLGTALPVASGGTGSTTATFSGANITSLNATNISSGILAVTQGGTGATTATGTAGSVVLSTTPTITGEREVRIAGGTGGAYAVNLATGNYFTRTFNASGAVTVTNVPASGTAQCFIFDINNAGAYSITWMTGTKWPGGVAPVLTVSGRDVLAFFTHDGGTTWNGFVLGLDVK
jgi:hypothetical protein